MQLEMIDGRFSVCRLRDAAGIRWQDDFVFVGRTDRELSLICREASEPGDCESCERGFCMLRVVGVLDMALVGVLAGLLNPLAERDIPVMAMSTYDTDYLMVRESRLVEALHALREAGYQVVG